MIELNKVRYILDLDTAMLTIRLEIPSLCPGVRQGHGSRGISFVLWGGDKGQARYARLLLNRRIGG